MIGILVLCVAVSVDAEVEGDTPTKVFLDSIDGKFKFLADNWAASRNEYGAQKYWLVRLEPLAAGHYTVSHDRQNVTRLGGYERCEHTFRFSVAPHGARRVHTTWGPSRGTHPAACLGDAVVLAFDLSPHYDDHRWSVSFEPSIQVPVEREPSKVAPVAAFSNVVNSLDTCLRIVGVDKGAYYYRTGEAVPYTTLSFEAIAQTNVTLDVSLSSSSNVTAPIAVVDMESKLDVFIGTALERHYTVGHGSMGGTWAQLQVEAFVLRPGDIVQMQVMGVVSSSNVAHCAGTPFVPRGRFLNYHVKWKDY